MFHGENHANGTGLKKYKDLGGNEGVLRSLKSDKDQGISSLPDELENRRIAYGTNAPRPIRIKTLCQLIKEQLDDQTLKILIVSCIASLAVGIWQDIDASLSGEKIVN